MKRWSLFGVAVLLAATGSTTQLTEALGAEPTARESAATHAAQWDVPATKWHEIPPVTLFDAGASGTPPLVFGHSGIVPPGATHGVFRGTMWTNRISGANINWYGINSIHQLPTVRMFSTASTSESSIRAVLLPFDSFQRSKWIAGVDSGSTAKRKIIGCMRITGLNMAQH